MPPRKAAENPDQTAPRKTLEEKLEDQRKRDKGRSPLLSTLRSLERLHGAKALELAIKQWRNEEFPDEER
jgi:hypothetical protein